MPSLRDIKRRIKSVQNTRQITRAMKMVAAAKMKRAEDNVTNARPFAVALEDLIGSVMLRDDVEVHPLLQPHEESERYLFVVVTADRGLCGGFNTNLIRKSTEILASVGREHVDIEPIGRRGLLHFRKRGYSIVREHSTIFGRHTFQMARQISDQLAGHFLDKTYKEVHVIYNRFVSAMRTDITHKILLPLQPRQARTDELLTGHEFEPDPQRIYEALLPRHLAIQVWQMMLESYAAEQAARMVAMENATNNAEEMIARLTLIYNRARQAAITKEIIEIVSGADALEG